MSAAPRSPPAAAPPGAAAAALSPTVSAPLPDLNAPTLNALNRLTLDFRRLPLRADSDEGGAGCFPSWEEELEKVLQDHNDRSWRGGEAGVAEAGGEKKIEPADAVLDPELALLDGISGILRSSGKNSPFIRRATLLV